MPGVISCPKAKNIRRCFTSTQAPEVGEQPAVVEAASAEHPKAADAGETAASVSIRRLMHKHFLWYAMIDFDNNKFDLPFDTPICLYSGFSEVLHCKYVRVCTDLYQHGENHMKHENEI